VVDASHQTAAISDESNLVFSGFAVFLDPPKTSAGATIQAMTAAGISVKVLTGDNELVSRHVFAEIGVPVTGVLTGDALTNLSEEALIGQLPRVNMFCRVNPQQKLRILLALKRLGNVVGFMGDGINDAPALHAADVGISVDGSRRRARGCRPDPAGARPFCRARRGGLRARHGSERFQVRPDGLKFEFW
jgi:Mg2+-importing ATPase